MGSTWLLRTILAAGLGACRPRRRAGGYIDLESNAVAAFNLRRRHAALLGQDLALAAAWIRPEIRRLTALPVGYKVKVRQTIGIRRGLSYAATGALIKVGAELLAAQR